MKKIKIISVILAVLCVVLLMAGCASRSEATVYGDSQSEVTEKYADAAKKQFKGCDARAISDLENGAPDTKYIFIISSDEKVLDQQKVAGLNFTVLAYDNGEDNLKVKILYKVGTEEDCVSKGAFVDGSADVGEELEFNTAGVTDAKERAKYLFDGVAGELDDLEK